MRDVWWFTSCNCVPLAFISCNLPIPAKWLDLRSQRATKAHKFKQLSNMSNTSTTDIYAIKPHVFIFGSYIWKDIRKSSSNNWIRLLRSFFSCTTPSHDGTLSPLGHYTVRPSINIGQGSVQCSVSSTCNSIPSNFLCLFHIFICDHECSIVSFDGLLFQSIKGSNHLP